MKPLYKCTLLLLKIVYLDRHIHIFALSMLMDFGLNKIIYQFHEQNDEALQTNLKIKIGVIRNLKASQAI